MANFYEVLDVAENASAAEIKAQYRKLALLFHPDKNLVYSEETTHRFRLVQEAYEVLSDECERAWYDSHTLLGNAGFSNVMNPKMDQISGG